MVEVRKDARAAGRGAIAIVATQTLSRAMLLGFVIISARKVGPDQFSRYATVAALLVVTGFIVDFGTTSATTKVISAGEDSDKVLRNSLTACALLGLLGYLVGIVLAGLIGRSTSAVVDFALAGFFLPLEGITTSLTGALDGRGLITQRSIVSLFRLGLGPLIGIIVIELTYNIRLAMVGLAIGPTVATVVAVIITYRYRVWSLRVRLNPMAGRSLIRQAIPFAVIVGASATLARIDVLILSAISSKVETADYNLALRAVEALQYPLWAMLGPTLYLFSKRLAARDVEGAVRAYQVVIKAFFAISLPLAAGAVVLGHQVIEAIFGQAYAGAGTPLVISVHRAMAHLCDRPRRDVRHLVPGHAPRGHHDRRGRSGGHHRPDALHLPMGCHRRFDRAADWRGPHRDGSAHVRSPYPPRVASGFSIVATRASRDRLRWGGTVPALHLAGRSHRRGRCGLWGTGHHHEGPYPRRGPRFRVLDPSLTL